MRIAHVTATFPPYMGGTGWVCYYNALGLARRRHRVSVYTSVYPPEPFPDPPELTVHRLPARVRVGNAPVLPGLLAIQDVDLIHLHHPFLSGSEFVFLNARRRGIPYVVTHHNDLLGGGLRRYLFNGYSALFVPLILRGARRVVVVSHDYAAASQHRALFAARGRDVVEIPNGVDTEHFSPHADGRAVRSRYGIQEGTPIVLFVGALDRAHAFKGVPVLLQAFSRIAVPNAVLMLVGEGDLRDEYRTLARSLGIGARTLFVGTQPHARLPGYYAAADVGVLPSVQTESFGMVLVEAMACGKPVIATNLPGVRTVVNDGQDGVLVAPGDADALCENLQMLLTNPKHSRALGEEGRAKVEAKYSWATIIPRLERVYMDALSS